MENDKGSSVGKIGIQYKPSIAGFCVSFMPGECSKMHCIQGIMPRSVNITLQHCSLLHCLLTIWIFWYFCCVPTIWWTSVCCSTGTLNHWNKNVTAVYFMCPIFYFSPKSCHLSHLIMMAPQGEMPEMFTSMSSLTMFGTQIPVHFDSDILNILFKHGHVSFLFFYA